MEEQPTPSVLALKYSRWYGGKIEIAPKVPVRNLNDFAIWYTPGVAAVSSAIKGNKDLSFEYTGRWNTIAIITDGSRVLGLGDVGAEASLPVMEGKSLIYKYLGGVNAIPLPIDVHDPDGIIETVKRIQPAVGGINLEDIASPKCFYILDRLRKEMGVPVWHDDQQGTAGVVLGGLLPCLKMTGRKLRGSRVVFFGAGAANIATAHLFAAAGADYSDMVMVDSKGILHPEREDIDNLKKINPWKYDLAIKTNRDGLGGDLPVAMKGADAIIAASKPGPDIIKKEWVRTMNKDAIVFALANPVPEMWPEDAKEAGARIVATGLSALPNQINNSLLFPSAFRGILDVRARTITDEMVIAAAEEIARFAEERGVREDYITPTMVEWEVYPRVAAEVGAKAVEQGLARTKLSKDEVYKRASDVIQRSRKLLGMLTETQLVPMPPERL